jgi:hypothetical protein
MSRKSIAIAVDALSADFIFPIWHRYYSNLFGAENLFVTTFEGGDPGFSDFELGKLTVAEGFYNDDKRVKLINATVAELLKRYDVVIRVDVDEFLVVDPARYGSLREFLESWEGPYITARGFDLMQWRDENPLDPSKKVLHQRQWGYALDAMNKTCVTRIPFKWGRGFHYCSAPPVFGEVFLFHLKRIDLEQERSWCRKMIESAKGDVFVSEYYSSELGFIDSFARSRWNLPADEGPDALIRDAFLAEFRSKVHFVPETGSFDGPYNQEKRNIRIPDRFRDLF